MTLSSRLLLGKTAVITGCLKGIGLATLDLFAENGADIFACSQFETEDFIQHIHYLSNESGVHIYPVYFDLCDSDQLKSAIKYIRSFKKNIDVLVNVAGMTQDALFHMTSMEQMKKIFEVNFFSQILFTQYITKLMLQNKAGSVINISSISALDGNLGQVAYSSSKAALIGATKTMSIELAPHGIRVNVIAPGVIKTDMIENLPMGVMDKQLAKIKLKHFGMPPEVASVILFLASDMSSYITGQMIRIDGGIN